MLTIKSIISFVKQAVPSIISAVQGDNGRSVLFTSSDFTIPAGATAEYHIRHPSGTTSGNATITEGRVLVNLTAEDTADPGDNYGQVRITADSQSVTSFDFILAVDEFRGESVT